MSFQVNSSSFSAHSLILSAMLLYHLKDLIYVLHTKLLYNWISRQFVSMCGCFMYNNVPLNIPTYNFPTLKRTFQVHQHWIFLKHIVIHTYTLYTHEYKLYRKDGKAGKRHYDINFKDHFDNAQNQNNIEFCSEFT